MILWRWTAQYLRIFADTVSADNRLSADTVSADYRLSADTVSADYRLSADTPKSCSCWSNCCAGYLKSICGDFVGVSVGVSAVYLQSICKVSVGEVSKGYMWGICRVSAVYTQNMFL